MKTINLCNRESCCPRLVIERNNGKLKFHLIDNDTKIVLDAEIARNFALTIFEEIGK
jgi:hypothetical protein